MMVADADLVAMWKVEDELEEAREALEKNEHSHAAAHALIGLLMAKVMELRGNWYASDD